MSLETWSDVCGLLSGLALLVTAWRNDALFGYVEGLRAAVDKAKAAGHPEDKAVIVIESLEDEASKWGLLDRWCLRAGAALLVLSFLLDLLG